MKEDGEKENSLYDNLYKAIMEGNNHKTSQLLKEDTIPNLVFRKDEDNDTLLHIALRQEPLNFDIIKSIINSLDTDQQRHLLSQQNNDKETPLNLAISKTHAQNDQSVANKIVKYIAIRMNHFDLCNIRDDSKNTILHNAILFGNATSVSTLLATELTLAKHKTKYDEKMAKEFANMLKNKLNDNTEVTPQYPEWGLDINYFLDSSGETVFHKAAYKGDLDKLEDLYQFLIHDTKSKDLSFEVDEELISPMHVAAYQLNIDTLKFFIEHCSRNHLLEVNKDGNNAIHLIVEYNEPELFYLKDRNLDTKKIQNAKEAIKLLVNAGIDLNQQNLQGKTAIELAQESGNSKMVQLINEVIKEQAIENNTKPKPTTRPLRGIDGKKQSSPQEIRKAAISDKIINALRNVYVLAELGREMQESDFNQLGIQDQYKASLSNPQKGEIVANKLNEMLQSSNNEISEKALEFVKNNLTTLMEKTSFSNQIDKENKNPNPGRTAG